jgi:GT2 family glycosyltransferase
MDLSIVILHHGSPKEVTANLQALRKAELPKKTEVLVINNGVRGANAQIPFDPTPAFDLRYFEIENGGYPQGNNFGLRIAKGKFLCILNPDIVTHKETFKVLIDYLKTHTRVGIVGPRLRYPDGTVQDNYRKFPRPLDLFIKRTFLRRFFTGRMRQYLMWDKDPKKSEAVDWLTGAFQVFTRKAWEALKPNDERYFLFMSDVDICRKAWQHGFEVHFVGETEALHNDERLSAGGIMAFFKKRVMRIHVADAMKYYAKFLFKPLPKKCPSRLRSK